MFDRLDARALPPGTDGSASNALRDDAITASRNAPESNSPAANTKLQALPEQNARKKDSPAESANDKRKAEEARMFRDYFQKHNVELDPMKQGEGPYQSLEQMRKEGKIAMNHDQMMAEARRIASRDFKEMGRNFYTGDDHVKLWSEKEIDQMVKADVEKPKGVDVSNWQHTIDWKQVKDAGYQFAMMKATEGVDFIDPTFDKFRQGARDAGLKTGYYHYFHPSDPVADQVKLFCDVVGKAEPDSLRLVIDAEDENMWRKYPLDQRVKMVDDFLQGVKDRLGVTPQVCIYCSNNFANEILGNSPAMQKYSLWIADWRKGGEPNIPDPWDNYDFWQFTDGGTVPGIPGKVDVDMFNGTDLSQDKPKSQNKK